MQRIVQWIAMLALIAAALAGCGGSAVTPDLPTEAPQTPAPTTGEPAPVEDLDTLIARLGADGASVEQTAGEGTGLFDITPALITVNGGEVQVYEFADEAGAQAAAATIPDLLARTRWDAPPHFFRAGRIVVLYVGADNATLEPLVRLLGAEVGADGDAESVDTVQIFLIALEGNGTSGDLIGCGDSVIPVERPIPPTASPIEAALTELFASKDQFYGESGLYNALYQSTLAVESATLDDAGLATVYLTGDLLMGGECDTPRIKAQIEYTVLQFPGVDAVQVFLNNVALDDLLSAQG